jgi:hypothetical protein
MTAIRSFRERFGGGGGGGGVVVVVVVILFIFIPVSIRIDLWISLSAIKKKRLIQEKLRKFFSFSNSLRNYQQCEIPSCVRKIKRRDRNLVPHTVVFLNEVFSFLEIEKFLSNFFLVR